MMKKSFTGFLIALTITIFAHVAGAADPPVIVTHTLTGYSKGPSSVTLEYSLHVVNPGETPLADLTLSLVPRPPFVTTRTTVTVGFLGPKQSADMPMKLVTPLLLEKDHFSQKTLPWAGKGLNAEGKRVEFPVKSRPRGAK
jgi:hypothetical protein